MLLKGQQTRKTGAIHMYTAYASPASFCSWSLIESSLLIRGRKLVGSLRNVMSRFLRNMFMPVSNVCGALAYACIKLWSL